MWEFVYHFTISDGDIKQTLRNILVVNRMFPHRMTNKCIINDCNIMINKSNKRDNNSDKVINFRDN